MKKVVAATLTLLCLCALAASDVGDKQGEYIHARIRYHMQPSSGRQRELPWHHDYPFSDEMFPTFLKEVTTIHTTRESFEIVDIDSPDLFKYPFSYMSEPGFLNLLPEDVVNLKEYLERGGFVFLDDFRGASHLANLRQEMKKVYPDRDFVRLDLSHPIFHTYYEMETLDMVPPYGNMPVEFWALLDNRRNVQMIANYNNDLGELWEWLDRDEMPLRDASMALRFGVDYLIYAMTH